jgi:hypothetical protein
MLQVYTTKVIISALKETQTDKLMAEDEERMHQVSPMELALPSEMGTDN